MENQLNCKLYYSIAETAELLCISVGLCRKLVGQNRIPAIRMGERRLIVPSAALKAALDKMLSEGQGLAKGEGERGKPCQESG